MRYKGHYIWYSSIDNRWIVQCGYTVLARYATIGSAKTAITKKWSNL